jgi:hypothetical protein
MTVTDIMSTVRAGNLTDVQLNALTRLFIAITNAPELPARVATAILAINSAFDGDHAQ